ncbi:MAG: hypothetical protein M1834_005694 [Cirrosporium novae-zelandiae]|nr:MAG: hypothetical protein M1834_005694 [Cirrosporium novae-zelandiae]
MRLGGFKQPFSKQMSCLWRRISWPIAIIFAIIFTTAGIFKDVPISHQFQSPLGDPSPNLFSNGAINSYRHDINENLLLDHQQCQREFPGLFEEVDRHLRNQTSRKITIGQLDEVKIQNGYVRAMIYSGKIYIIATKGKVYSRGLATLQALHAAVITSPETIPNIEFIFNVDDRVDPTLPQWTYARRPSETELWLMPDFGYWSWPEAKVGSYGEVRLKAATLEEEYPWRSKVDKLVWRGATMELGLRESLLNVTRGQDWADVKALRWHDNSSLQRDYLPMADHCKYKYLAHTEGNSYSGRLKYLQNCDSVIVAHKMDWIQHHHPLLRSSGSAQNYVEVDRTFKNLNETIQWLRSHDHQASRIASNSIRTFRDKYLTPAATTCYWRRLIRAWKIATDIEPEFFRDDNRTRVWRGLPIESYLLERRLDWEPY